MSALCSEEKLSALMKAISAGSDSSNMLLSQLINEFPDDPRLHFLQASIMVGEGRLIEAHGGFARALELEPDFAIARFQMGFFQLTSGEASDALETWGRLDRLPDGSYLRHFVDGLRCLIRDDFEGTLACLRKGIASNDDNLPLNRDMGLIFEQCEGLVDVTTTEEAGEAVSETALILKQFSDRTKLH
jgi:tetratricopeptide (TPR) repeat protein